ncbi:MAG: heme-binding protein [Pseudomonadota bacterium]
MSGLTLAKAQEILQRALDGPRTDDSRTVAIVIVDAGGHALAMGREHAAPPLLSHIAEAKAKSCITYGKPTRTIMEWATETPIWFEGVSRVAQSRTGLPLIGSHGGVMIRDTNGALIGAVGVAGEAGHMDERLAVLGIEGAGFTAQAE